MITNHRLSILHRPKRPSAAQKNLEHADLEFQKEQDYWAGKAQRHAEVSEQMRRNLYTMPEDMARNRDEAQHMQEEQQYFKLHQKQMLAEQDSAWMHSVPDWHEAELIGQNKPWTVPSQLLTAEEEDAARRAHERLAAEENREMMIAKAQRLHEEEQYDKDVTRMEQQTEENWFNYGAASEKWIPPERRLHPRSEYREMEGKRDAPFHWNPTPNPARPMTEYRAYEQGRESPTNWDAEPLPPHRRPRSPSPNPITQGPVRYAAPAVSCKPQPAKEYPWTWHT
ncbi:hypothetical protein ABBQ38_012970 [Trebouxia sp. C0009 RCD-2024]